MRRGRPGGVRSDPISWILTSLTHAVCYFIVKRRRLRGLMEGVPTV